MSLGFSFRQAMSGSCWMLDAPIDERAIAFHIRVEAPNVRAFARDKSLRATGRIDVERLASDRPLEGTVTFRLFEERRIGYRLAFSGDDGRGYELSGLEEWSRVSPLASLAVLPASLYDERGEEIARATLRFDWRSDWATWMKSFRLSWHG